MTISLSPEVQRRIERKVAEGQYGSADDLVRDALDALESRENSSHEQEGRFGREIREALEEVERGEYVDYSREELPQVFEQARARGLELLSKTHPHSI